MEIPKLRYESSMTVRELAAFLFGFDGDLESPIDTPTETDSGLLMKDIYLGDKTEMFKNALAAFNLCINRVRKLSQTASMTNLNKLRKKQLSGHFNVICGSMTETNEAKAEAAALLLPVVTQHKGYYKLTSSALSTHIRKYIETLRSEKYLEAFNALELEERTAELEQTNEEYIQLASERADERKNVPASPSEMRKKCVQEYRKLVDLINFALANNKYYIYDEVAAKLIAITAEAQELINRRRNGNATEKETETVETETTV